ncbi:MAG: hypothetical protein H0V17_06395, partial [Deltaproteobacteria bacterium]|nr:hypothetical protein [Deltaproteobacteria bacterium]
KDDETIAWQNVGVTRHRPGLALNGFRTYDPWIGSYLQVDPLVDSTWSSYLYVNSDPVGKRDPNGLNWVIDTLGDLYYCRDTFESFEAGGVIVMEAGGCSLFKRHSNPDPWGPTGGGTEPPMGGGPPGGGDADDDSPTEPQFLAEVDCLCSCQFYCGIPLLETFLQQESFSLKTLAVNVERRAEAECGRIGFRRCYGRRIGVTKAFCTCKRIGLGGYR